MASKQLKTSPKQKWLIAVFSSSRIVAHYEKKKYVQEKVTPALKEHTCIMRNTMTQSYKAMPEM